MPDAVVVSVGGNALTSRPAPQLVREDAPSLIVSVADGLRWLITCLGLNGAPEATGILITAVPRAQLTAAGLAAYRQLANAERAVAREFHPHDVLLDVERLLYADRSAPGSWHRQLTLRGSSLGGPVVTEVVYGAADVWSLEPLPRDFPEDVKPGD